ncbi:hypothetical protein DY000_02026831 [Brassica cretica]|uniref:Protein kinase domain-containing protein n=1 Tax=Brassica cretica TaxID=69181 RepID=A0ABQ7E1R5_BRACR|nr:hypothetical protein DY000_02026831 [Brassica cretica]
MPNGSLDKFIPEDVSTKMDCEALYNIALGVARGLDYLHNSCVSKIVHFDIKPHNILLDENLCPKISDFGLAKLCKKKDSIISMLDARETVGYIAPEAGRCSRVEALVVPPKPLLTPAIMAWETVEESEETSSLLTLSQLDRF